MFPGGFKFLRNQISEAEIYPIAEFCDVTIDDLHQRCGYGRDAFRAFAIIARRHGAKLGMLRVATQGEEYVKGLAWRRAFYQSEGWRDFSAPPGREYSPHWMFTHLRETKEPTRPVEEIVRELDEFEEWCRPMMQWTAHIGPTPSLGEK